MCCSNETKLWFGSMLCSMCSSIGHLIEEIPGTHGGTKTKNIENAHRIFFCSDHIDYMGMDQYLLIPFLGGWTSIYELFWCELQGYKVLTHCHMPSSLCPANCGSFRLSSTMKSKPCTHHICIFLLMPNMKIGEARSWHKPSKKPSRTKEAVKWCIIYINLYT